MTERLTDEALLPCPFCGGAATLYNKQLPLFPVWWVECSQRPYPHHSNACKTSAEAIAAWNRRATPADDLRRENEGLRTALEFYADRNFNGYEIDISDYGLSMKTGAIIKDEGEIARAALSQNGGAA